MANEILRARLQTPQDEKGNRKDIMLVTDITSVIIDGENPETSKSLKDELNKVEENITEATEKVNNNQNIIISKSQPVTPYRHLWGEITKTDYTWDFEHMSSTYVDGYFKIVSNDYGADDDSDEEFDPDTMVRLKEVQAFNSNFKDGHVGNYVTMVKA